MTVRSNKALCFGWPRSEDIVLCLLEPNEYYACRHSRLTHPNRQPLRYASHAESLTISIIFAHRPSKACNPWTSDTVKKNNRKITLNVWTLNNKLTSANDAKQPQRTRRHLSLHFRPCHSRSLKWLTRKHAEGSASATSFALARLVTSS